MENAVLQPDGMQETLLDDSVDLDLIDELLSEEVWLETLDGSEFLQQCTSTTPTPFDASYLSPLYEIENRFCNPSFEEYPHNGDIKRSNSSKKPTQLQEGTKDMVSTQLNPCTKNLAQCSGQQSEIREAGPSSWSMEPRASPRPKSSLKERLMKTLSYIKDSYRDSDVLVQIWVPINNGDRQVLTTYGQPFSLNPNCQRLMNYRAISTGYQFSAEENSEEALGLPGRVFLGKLPEWSPDVRYFSNYEYPRVNYAQHYDVRGTLAIPVFQRGSRICLGVIEVVMTTEKVNYGPDLEHICSALKAVDLNSSDVLGVPNVKMKSDDYLAALPEISVALRAVCQAHRLPLAQTWVPCFQQGKSGSRHTDENYEDCVSTVDASCYVNDPFLSHFHEACSEHHLLRGQGVVGEAFTTNQPCFSSDITSFSKMKYPLSHHARMFGLRAAVAIRLRSVQTGKADFVLEFFLPKDCRTIEEQKAMLNSLSTTLQQVCQNLRVVTVKELKEETVLQVNMQLPSDGVYTKHLDGDNGCEDESKVLLGPQIDKYGPEQSRIASIIETQSKDENSVLSACASVRFEEQELQGFTVISQWGNSEVELPEDKSASDCTHPSYQASAKSTNESRDSFTGQSSFPSRSKSKERKQTKIEKSISLQILQQYFAGSLKDAAKSLGVCPTTLKRICRQHGINRWPSRKIKKVGHSLRKLQVVIDSVQGVDGAFQLSSLYPSFPKSCSSEVSTQKTTGKGMICKPRKDNDPESSNEQHGLLSNSLSSSCSQISSSSNCSSGEKQYIHAAESPKKEEVSFEENQSGLLKTGSNELELRLSSQETMETLPRSQSVKSIGENAGPGSLSPLCQNRHVGDLLRVKAMYRGEKVRFSLQATWGIQELKQEITKRFHISDMNSVDLQYLDDESEWVLLTCDADLQECTSIYRSSCLHTIKISVRHAALPSIISSGSGL